MPRRRTPRLRLAPKPKTVGFTRDSERVFDAAADEFFRALVKAWAREHVDEEERVRSAAR